MRRFVILEASQTWVDKVKLYYTGADILHDSDRNDRGILEYSLISIITTEKSNEQHLICIF